jgi:hypothetical protein
VGVRLSYHGIVAAASFVVPMGAVGTRSAPAVLIDPLREAAGRDLRACELSG